MASIIQTMKTIQNIVDNEHEHMMKMLRSQNYIQKEIDLTLVPIDIKDLINDYITLNTLIPHTSYNLPSLPFFIDVEYMTFCHEDLTEENDYLKDQITTDGDVGIMNKQIKTNNNDLRAIEFLNNLI